MDSQLTVDEVCALVRVQSAGKLSTVNHGITLNDTLVEPRAISVIDRQVKNGRIVDRVLTVWLVGQEKGKAEPGRWVAGVVS
jgi:hypothetical protein